MSYDAPFAVSQAQLNVLASANGASYDNPTLSLTDIQVASINFQNLHETAPANGQVVLKQGYNYGGALTANTTVVAWNFYVLDNISADRTITLPAGTAGDSIKFSNMSAFNSSGNYVEPTYHWMISPVGSDKIMRATSLRLDESTSSFELFYTDSANGWVLNGIT